MYNYTKYKLITEMYNIFIYKTNLRKYFPYYSRFKIQIFQFNRKARMLLNYLILKYANSFKKQLE